MLRTARVVVAGAAGILAKDLMLQGAVAAGWARYDLWAVLARPFLGGANVTSTASPAVAAAGLLVHLAIGIAWAALVGAVRSRSRAALARSPAAVALLNTAVIWSAWGLTFPALGLGPAPWALGAATTALTLAGDLAYSLVVALW